MKPTRIRRSAWLLPAVALLSAVAVAAPASAAPLPSLPIGPPAYTVHVDRGGAPGYVFYSTGMSAAAVIPAVPGMANPASNVIATKSGRVVWQYTAPRGQGVANFRMQTLNGRKVLTWWQGSSNGGHGTGHDVIAEAKPGPVRIIKRLGPGGGLSSDVHEFRLTADGRALITSYQPMTADLRAIGGPARGTMLDCIASVVDVNSGRVLARWRASQHVPLTDSESPRGVGPGAPFDPFHMNSIALAPSGNLIISMRNTATVYEVNPRTGVIVWRLGGKRPTLRAPGVEFAFQHDAEFVGPHTITLFNNNSSGTDTRGTSSAMTIDIDAAHGRASLVHDRHHPAGVTAFAMGNVQTLPDGNQFVGWGIAPRISEFDGAGRLVYDASLPVGSYRAFLEAWNP